MFFADLDDQGMEFIIEFCIFRQVFHEQALHFVVVCIILNQAMSGQDPFGISIHHKKRLSPCIEQNRVGRLGADAINTKQVRAQLHSDIGKHPFQASAVMIPDQDDKIL